MENIIKKMKCRKDGTIISLELNNQIRTAEDNKRFLREIKQRFKMNKLQIKP
jgi:hypothetical protein